MTFLYSQIIGLPVGSIEDRAKVGSVRDIVINPDDGKVLGLTVRAHFFGSQPQIISWQDVRDIDKNGAVVTSKEVIVSIDEIVRAADLLNDNFNLIDLPVETTSGQAIGAVSDYEIDGTVGALTKIHTRQLLGKNRIINHSKILRIQRDKIIIRADGERSRAAIAKTIPETA